MYPAKKTDILSKYFKIAYQTDHPYSPTSTWVTKIEDHACHYLDLIFANVNRKNSKAESPPPPSMDDLNKIINDVTKLIRHLDSDSSAITMPILGNLVFLKKQAISRVPNDEAYKMIMEFKTHKKSQKWRDLSNTQRLDSLVTFVDNMRRFSEIMMNAVGCEEFGHSPRRLNYQFRRKERERVRTSKISFKHLTTHKETTLVKSAPKASVKAKKLTLEGGPANTVRTKSGYFINKSALLSASVANANVAAHIQHSAPPNTPNKSVHIEHSSKEHETEHSSSPGEMGVPGTSLNPSSVESAKSKKLSIKHHHVG